MTPRLGVAASALLCAVVCCASVVASAGGAPPPEAVVGGGRLRGKWLETRDGRPIAAFEGIPYAAPPVGDLRFKAPQPAKPWNSVREATQPGSVCTQRNLYFGQKDVVGDEDCLYLNVYVPEGVDDDTNLDVLFFIHGGGWISGSGDVYQPDYLLDHDVILVTHNYRLGPLGFLSTSDNVIPGNNGLKDQMAALRWVRDNIASFGGNPKSVTIFGESAGGGSVHIHLLSPLAKGLFHKAIMQSGNCFAPWAMAPPGEPRRHAARMAKHLECPSSPSTALRDCLLGKSNLDITGVDLIYLEWGINPMIPFKPVVEPAGPEAVIDRHPKDILTSGQYNDVPTLLGFTSHEGCIVALSLYSNETILRDFDERFNIIFPMTMLIRHLPLPLQQEVTQQARKFYYGDGPILMDSVDNTINLFSDAMFTWPTIKVVQMHAKYGKSPLFMYEFSHLSHRSFSILFGSKGADYGVCHADDLLHLFPLKELFPKMEPSVDDEITSRKFTEYFVTFAKAGKPTKDNSWQRVAHPEEAEYLHIGSPGDIAMRANYASNRINFWKDLPVQIGQMMSAHDEL